MRYLTITLTVLLVVAITITAGAAPTRRSAMEIGGTANAGHAAGGTDIESDGDIKMSGDLIVDGGEIGVTGDADLLGLASGVLTLNGSMVLDDAANIGCDSDTDLVGLGSGVLTLNGALVVDTAATIGCDADTDLLTIGNGVLTITGAAVATTYLYSQGRYFYHGYYNAAYRNVWDSATEGSLAHKQSSSIGAVTYSWEPTTASDGDATFQLFRNATINGSGVGSFDIYQPNTSTKKFTIAAATGNTSSGGTFTCSGQLQGGNIVTAGTIVAGSGTISVTNATGNVLFAALADSANIGRLDQAETIAGNWVNTANPWADNEVSDTLTASIVTGDGTTEIVGMLRDVVLDADGSTITIAQAGSVQTNGGAIGGSICNLPEASTAVGMQYTFVVHDAQNFDINPDNADQILGLTNAAGDCIRSATIGETVTLLAIDATSWVVVGVYGTWTDQD